MDRYFFILLLTTCLWGCESTVPPPIQEDVTPKCFSAEDCKDENPCTEEHSCSTTGICQYENVPDEIFMFHNEKNGRCVGGIFIPYTECVPDWIGTCPCDQGYWGEITCQGPNGVWPPMDQCVCPD